MNILISGIRGAGGFGLGGCILLAVVVLVSSAETPRNEEISVVGEWQGSGGPVRSARFTEDGTFMILTPKGKATEGSYRVVDATRAELPGDSGWKEAALIVNPEFRTQAATELNLTDVNGTVTRMRWFRRSAPAMRSTGKSSWGGFFVLVFLSGAVGAMVLTLGSGRTVRGAAGFGCGAIPAAFVVIFTMISLQGGGRPDYVWGALGCGVGFAVMGAIGGFAIRPALLLPGAIAFGLAGTVFGPVVFRLEADGTLGGMELGKEASVLALLAPIMAGGGLFGLAAGILGIDGEGR